MEFVRPNIVVNQQCTFCATGLPKPFKRSGDAIEANCPCCGLYRITGSAADAIAHWDMPESEWITIAHHIRKMTDRADPPGLDYATLKAIRETANLPHPDQIIDEFVMWLGNKSRWPAETMFINYVEHRAVLGAVDGQAFDYMTQYISQTPWFAGARVAPIGGATEIRGCALSPRGWERFRQLMRSHSASKYGFVAMQYGNAELDAVVRNHFVPQTQLAGFDLRRLDDNQAAAGLIDDQLRVRIRLARFLICDLTHGNRGAYWEAGFAEGLGLPVIYSCRRNIDPASIPRTSDLRSLYAALEVSR
jgi:hypothetical protein